MLVASFQPALRCVSGGGSAWACACRGDASMADNDTAPSPSNLMAESLSFPDTAAIYPGVRPRRKQTPRTFIARSFEVVGELRTGDRDRDLSGWLAVERAQQKLAAELRQ